MSILIICVLDITVKLVNSNALSWQVHGVVEQSYQLKECKQATFHQYHFSL